MTLFTASVCPSPLKNGGRALKTTGSFLKNSLYRPSKKKD
jgi:hypothetical protein